MKTHVSTLTGAALDWAVAKGEGTLGHYVQPNEKRGTTVWEVIPQTRRYSTNWAQGGPVIEHEELYLQPTGDAAKWKAYRWVDSGKEEGNFSKEYYGATPLIAAMRCYVASKLGAEVDIPEELKETQ